MPYERRGRKVYRADTGELVGESDSVAGAKRYMRALYANVHKAVEITDDLLDEMDAEMVDPGDHFERIVGGDKDPGLDKTGMSLSEIGEWGRVELPAGVFGTYVGDPDEWKVVMREDGYLYDTMYVYEITIPPTPVFYIMTDPASGTFSGEFGDRQAPDASIIFSTVNHIPAQYIKLVRTETQEEYDAEHPAPWSEMDSYGDGGEEEKSVDKAERPKPHNQGTVRVQYDDGDYLVMLPDGSVELAGDKAGVVRIARKWAKKNNPTGFGVMTIDWSKVPGGAPEETTKARPLTIGVVRARLRSMVTAVHEEANISDIPDECYRIADLIEDAMDTRNAQEDAITESDIEAVEYAAREANSSVMSLGYIADELDDLAAEMWRAIGKSVEKAAIDPRSLLVSEKGLRDALLNVLSGRTSRSSGPIELWVLEDGRKLVVDGHHRLAEHMLIDPTLPIDAEIIGSGFTDYYATPKTPFTFADTRFGGLEEFADEDILVDAVARLKSVEKGKYDRDNAYREQLSTSIDQAIRTLKNEDGLLSSTVNKLETFFKTVKRQLSSNYSGPTRESQEKAEALLLEHHGPGRGWVTVPFDVLDVLEAINGWDEAKDKAEQGQSWGTKAAKTGRVGFWKDLSDEKVTGILQDLGSTGGFSVSTHDDTVPKTGYMVALPGYEERVGGIPPREQIQAYEKKHADILRPSNRYLGGWISDEGVFMFDVSEWVSSLADAMSLGRKRKQEGIYDLEAGETISLTGEDLKVASSGRVRFWVGCEPDDDTSCDTILEFISRLHRDCCHHTKKALDATVAQKLKGGATSVELGGETFTFTIEQPGYATVSKDGRTVGSVDYVVKYGKLKSMGTWVAEKYRRRGLASALYVFLETAMGKRFEPSSDLSEDGEALWGQGDRQFGEPERLVASVSVGKALAPDIASAIRAGATEVTLAGKRIRLTYGEPTEIDEDASDADNDIMREYGSGIQAFEAYDGDKLIGHMDMEAGGKSPLATEVDPRYRRMGIASAPYVYAETVLGHPLKPSKTQTYDGTGLWLQDNPLFGEERMVASVEMRKAANQSDVDLVPLSSLLPCPYNREVDKAKVETIAEAIIDSGEIKPLVVTEVKTDDGDQLMITDGHHRYLALKKLGVEEVPVVMADEDGVESGAGLKAESVDVEKAKDMRWKKGPEFYMDGEWLVTYQDKTYRVARDPENGYWYGRDIDDYLKPNPYAGIIGYSKSDVEESIRSGKVDEKIERYGRVEKAVVHAAIEASPALLQQAKDAVESYISSYELPSEQTDGRFQFVLTRAYEDSRDTTLQFDVIPEGGTQIEDEFSPKFQHDTPQGAVNDIPANPDLAYRGMSFEEYSQTKQTGRVQSRGQYNIGQEGLTFFSPDPDGAAYYASGFSPLLYKPSEEKPGVVIAIPRDKTMDSTDDKRIPGGELAIEGSLPASEIVEVYFVVPSRTRAGRIELIVDNKTGKVKEGSRANPGGSVVFHLERDIEAKSRKKSMRKGEFDEPTEEVLVGDDWEPIAESVEKADDVRYGFVKILVHYRQAATIVRRAIKAAGITSLYYQTARDSQPPEGNGTPSFGGTITFDEYRKLDAEIARLGSSVWGSDDVWPIEVYADDFPTLEKATQKAISSYKSILKSIQANHYGPIAVQAKKVERVLDGVMKKLSKRKSKTVKDMEEGLRKALNLPPGADMTSAIAYIAQNPQDAMDSGLTQGQVDMASQLHDDKLNTDLAGLAAGRVKKAGTTITSPNGGSFTPTDDFTPEEAAKYTPAPGVRLDKESGLLGVLSEVEAVVGGVDNDLQARVDALTAMVREGTNPQRQRTLVEFIASDLDEMGEEGLADALRVEVRKAFRPRLLRKATPSKEDLAALDEANEMYGGAEFLEEKVGTAQAKVGLGKIKDAVMAAASGDKNAAAVLRQGARELRAGAKDNDEAKKLADAAERVAIHNIPLEESDPADIEAEIERDKLKMSKSEFSRKDKALQAIENHLADAVDLALEFQGDKWTGEGGDESMEELARDLTQLAEYVGGGMRSGAYADLQEGVITKSETVELSSLDRDELQKALDPQVAEEIRGGATSINLGGLDVELKHGEPRDSKYAWGGRLRRDYDAADDEMESFEAWVGNELAGHVDIITSPEYPEWEGTYTSYSTEVLPDFKRMGIASALYVYAETVLGVDVAPSGEQTGAGEAFWRQGDDKLTFGDKDKVKERYGEKEPDEEDEPDEDRTEDDYEELLLENERKLLEVLRAVKSPITSDATDKYAQEAIDFMLSGTYFTSSKGHIASGEALSELARIVMKLADNIDIDIEEMSDLTDTDRESLLKIKSKLMNRLADVTSGSSLRLSARKSLSKATTPIGPAASLAPQVTALQEAVRGCIEVLDAIEDEETRKTTQAKLQAIDSFLSQFRFDNTGDAEAQIRSLEGDVNAAATTIWESDAVDPEIPNALIERFSELRDSYFGGVATGIIPTQESLSPPTIYIRVSESMSYKAGEIQAVDDDGDGDLFYCVFLSPDSIDLQSDVISRTEIRKTVTEMKAKLSEIKCGWEHDGEKRDDLAIKAVFMAPGGFELNGKPVAKGSAVAIVKASGESLEKILSGELSGLSIEGDANRTPVDEATE